MFHKEGSCVEIVSSSSSSLTSGKSGPSKGKGGTKKKKKPQQQQQQPLSQQCTTTAKVVVDVPLRKSDRRKLRSRAGAYFFPALPPTTRPTHSFEDVPAAAAATVDGTATHDGKDNDNDGTTNTTTTTNIQMEQQQSQLEQLLDAIFLKGGTISSRSFPATAFAAASSSASSSQTKGNHEQMILYVKSPTPASSSEAVSDSKTTTNPTDNDTVSGGGWPYQHKQQFLWMAFEDTKSKTVLLETPTVALLAVLCHPPQQQHPQELPAVAAARVVTIPAPASKYICRGADLMRAGILQAPVAVVGAPSQPLTAAVASSMTITKNNNNSNKKNDSHSTKDMVMICVQGNFQPFAVGRSLLHENENTYGYGTKGVGVEIWNSYGDDLWRTTRTLLPTNTREATSRSRSSVNVDDGRYGNPGFLQSETGKHEVYVVPILSSSVAAVSEEEDDEENADDDDSIQDANNNGNSTTIATTATSTATASLDADQQETGTKDKQDNDPAQESRTKEVIPTKEEKDDNGTNVDDGDENRNSAAVVAEEAEEEEVPSPPTPDALLHDAVCQALINLKKNELPMLVGTFFTKHVLVAATATSTNRLDMKATSYKKFGNYIKQWQQQGGNDDAEDYGLLQTGPDPSHRQNTDPNALLLAFNRRHEDLHGRKKTRNTTTSRNSGGAGNIVLVSLYTIPHHWTALLRLNPDTVQATNASSEARKGTGMLTLPEARKILDAYLAREELVINKGTVQLDGPLSDALYKQKKKKPVPGSEAEGNFTMVPERVSRKDLAKQFLAKLGNAYALVSMPGSVITKLSVGSPPKIQIEVIRRQTRKFITKIRGLEEYFTTTNGVIAVEPSVFCKDIMKRFAISGTIDTDPLAAVAKKGYVEYVFGADIVNELEAILTGDDTLSDHGGAKHQSNKNWNYPLVPLSVIDVTLRKGVPPRKNRRGGGGSQQRKK